MGSAPYEVKMEEEEEEEEAKDLRRCGKRQRRAGVLEDHYRNKSPKQR